jgi:CBS domain containing-hemolysin-like protein
LVRTGQAAVPVVDDEDRPLGIVTRERVLRADGGERQADVAALLDADVAVVSAYACLEDAVRLLQERRRPVVVATDRRGAVVGLVSRETLNDLLLLELDRERDGQRPARGAVPTGSTA